MKGRLWCLAVGVAVLLLAGSAWAQERNELTDLLTATPWCSFQYDKVTGYSSTTRHQFFRDGSYTTGARSEGQIRGEAGTFVSQRNRTSAGTWRVKGNALFLTTNGIAQEPAHLSTKVNSNGVPIIVADGVEFSPCE